MKGMWSLLGPTGEGHVILVLIRIGTRIGSVIAVGTAQFMVPGMTLTGK